MCIFWMMMVKKSGTEYNIDLDDYPTRRRFHVVARDQLWK